MYTSIWFNESWISGHSWKWIQVEKSNYLIWSVKAIQIKNLMHGSSNRYEEESFRLDSWKVNNLHTNHYYIHMYIFITSVPQSPRTKPLLEFGDSEQKEKETIYLLVSALYTMVIKIIPLQENRVNSTKYMIGLTIIRTFRIMLQ